VSSCRPANWQQNSKSKSNSNSNSKTATSATADSRNGYKTFKWAADFIRTLELENAAIRGTLRPPPFLLTPPKKLSCPACWLSCELGLCKGSVLAEMTA